MIRPFDKVPTFQLQALAGFLLYYALFSGAAKAEPMGMFVYTNWLVGTWQHSTEQGHRPIYEHWTKVSDTELAAENYIIDDGNKTVVETIRLLQSDEGILYIPTVQNQNEGAPVRFALKFISGSKMIFTNSEHDFPKQISYEQLTDDSLVAELSGSANTVIQINMHRIE